MGGLWPSSHVGAFPPERLAARILGLILNFSQSLVVLSCARSVARRACRQLISRR
jgi:hypothetical protein